MRNPRAKTSRRVTSFSEGDDAHAAGKTLRDAGLRPRKRLGQNFLTDRSVPPRIADAAMLRPDDQVIEVGPGLGVLTEELAGGVGPEGGGVVGVRVGGKPLRALRGRF